MPCTVRDVSVCGLQLVTERPLPIGSGLSLLVNLPDAGGTRPLKLWGDVRWSNTREGDGLCSVGIRLRDRPERFVKVWRDIVRAKIRRHFAKEASTRAT